MMFDNIFLLAPDAFRVFREIDLLTTGSLHGKHVLIVVSK